MTTKTCATCKWAAVRESDDAGNYAKCDAPRNLKPTGFIADRRTPFCSHQRDVGRIMTRLLRLCGHEGRWWVAKDAGQ